MKIINYPIINRLAQSFKHRIYWPIQSILLRISKKIILNSAWLSVKYLRGKYSGVIYIYESKPNIFKYLLNFKDILVIKNYLDPNSGKTKEILFKDIKKYMTIKSKTKYFKNSFKIVYIQNQNQGRLIRYSSAELVLYLIEKFYGKENIEFIIKFNILKNYRSLIYFEEISLDFIEMIHQKYSLDYIILKSHIWLYTKTNKK